MSPHQMNPEELKALRELPGNTLCIDCGKEETEWASVTLGTFFCIDCSGRHRGLGTHISFVRSVKMDSWTDAQLEKMKKGGNQACKDFLIQHGLDFENLTIKERYDSPPAQLYQQVIKARVAGEPEPTELPKRQEVSMKDKPMQGFGSGPPPKAKKQRSKKKLATIGAAAVSVGAVVAMKFLRK